MTDTQNPEADGAGPRLFGISQSNRRPEEMWGKNCFNNAFPVALACYMWEKGVQPVYVRAVAESGSPSVEDCGITVAEVFGAPGNAGYRDLRFDFEARFEPYAQYVHNANEVDGSDLVVRHGERWLRPLQIKLTVVPDDGTSQGAPKDWAPELVLRPADSCVCALGIFARIADHAEEVEEIFAKPCADIQTWGNRTEMEVKRHAIFDCVERFLDRFRDRQQPYLLQPIWMTEGKSPALAANAFDLFVWSDHALVTAYLKQARGEAKINRATRALVRFARTQYELSTVSRIHIRSIYREMDFGRQTDKELALQGRVTRQYLISPRRASPILPPGVLPEIILGGGHKRLSPERRFDQTVYFTAENYFTED